MSHFSYAPSGGLERSLGEVYLNGIVSSGTNPIAHALGITQASNQTKLYISLHTGNPGVDFTGTEVSYTGYVRAEVRREGSFAAPSTTKWTYSNSGGSSFVNLEALTFPITPTGATGTVTHWGIYDASTGGNLLFHGPLVASGAEWRIGYSTGEDDTGAPNTSFVFSRLHGISPLDKIRAYGIYDGDLGSGSSATGATNGVELTVSTVSADSFVLSAGLATPGGILFIKSSSISLSAGKIPSIPAGGMKLRFA
jgi:hypothetical protein